MKKVVDKDTVAHLWANRQRDEARTPSGNLYFYGDTIYSYGSHFVIARHVTNGRGERATLFTKRTYSVTTSSQVTIVRQAARHLNLITVPDPDSDHVKQFEQWYKEIRGFADKLAKAKKPQKYIWEIRHVFNEAKIYADFFGYEIPGYLVEAGAIENDAQYIEVLKHETALRAAQEKKEQAAKLTRQKTDLKDWRSFKRYRITTVDGFDYLRYDAGQQRIQTSQQVDVPAGLGQRFYHYILAAIAKGGCTDCDYEILGFAVKAINKNFIHVGCHRISLREVKTMAKKLGWPTRLETSLPA